VRRRPSPTHAFAFFRASLPSCLRPHTNPISIDMLTGIFVLRRFNDLMLPCLLPSIANRTGTYPGGTFNYLWGSSVAIVNPLAFTAMLTISPRTLLMRDTALHRFEALINL